MKNKYLIQDIWIVNYFVPYKDKLFCPFIIRILSQKILEAYKSLIS